MLRTLWKLQSLRNSLQSKVALQQILGSACRSGSNAARSQHSRDFRFNPDCVVKRGCFLQLVLIEHWSACDCDVLHCARLTELSTDSLVDRLRRAGGCGGWRWAAEELDEAAQVLSGCGQEHFIFGSAQAAQPQPVELKDALHVREPHLDFFTFAT
jgi:hypothetical protein